MESADPAGPLVVPLLGVQVTPMTAFDVVAWIERSRGRKHVLANHNLHSVYLVKTSDRFRRFYECADRVVIDGAPVLRLARLRRRELTAGHRIGSTDWVERLDAGVAGRLCVLGSTSESNALAVIELRRRLGASGWEVHGLDGFTSDDDAVSWLQSHRPTLVLVGMGMPRQEEFLIGHWDALPPAVYATVGGAIDYIAGVTRLAPRWVGRLGLEWLWRLVHEPRRLARRYLVEPVELAWLIVRRR